MADRATDFAVRPDAFDPQPPTIATPPRCCLNMDFDSFDLTPTDHALMGEYLPENLDLSENTDLQFRQTETEKDAEDNRQDDDDVDSLFGPEVDDETDSGKTEDSTPATCFTPSPLPFQAAQLRGEVTTTRGALPVKPGVVEQSLTTGTFGTDAKPSTLCLPTGEPVRGHTDRKSPTASKRTEPRLALSTKSRSARKPSPSPTAPVTIATPASSSLCPSLPVIGARSSTTNVERELAPPSGTSSAASAAPTPATATLSTPPDAVRRIATAEAQASRNGSRVQSVSRPASPRAQRAAPPSIQATARAVAPAASNHAQAQRLGKAPSAPSAAFATSGSPSGMTPRIPSVLLPAPHAAHSAGTAERAPPAASSTVQSGKRTRNATANAAAPAPKRQAVKSGPPSSVASHPSMLQHPHRATSRPVAGPSRLSSIPTVPSNAPVPQDEAQAHSTIAARGYPVMAPAQSSSGSLVSPWSYSMARTRIQIPQPAKNISITTTSVIREPTAADVAKTRTRVPEPPLRLPLQNRWGFYYPDE